MPLLHNSLRTTLAATAIFANIAAPLARSAPELAVTKPLLSEQTLKCFLEAAGVNTKTISSSIKLDSTVSYDAQASNNKSLIAVEKGDPITGLVDTSKGMVLVMGKKDNNNQQIQIELKIIDREVHLQTYTGIKTLVGNASAMIDENITTGMIREAASDNPFMEYPASQIYNKVRQCLFGPPL